MICPQQIRPTFIYILNVNFDINRKLGQWNITNAGSDKDCDKQIEVDVTNNA